MKKIKFISTDKNSYELKNKPSPSRLHTPEWYRKAPMYYAHGKKENKPRIISGQKQDKNLTFKHCIPMLDGLNAGYMVELHSDIQCTVDEDNNYFLEWLQEQDIFSVHGDNTEFITPPIGYHKRVIKYHWLTVPKTPKGYSSLIIKPLGFNDLVLHQVPAIIDTDKSDQVFDLPMWVKEGYEGIIPKGTPLAQVIPFKRDNWQSEYVLDETYKHADEKGFLSVIQGFYKKNIWQKKNYK